ncbi:MAG: (Fe-S)-binding protein [Pseudomonadota bacterium]
MMGFIEEASLDLEELGRCSRCGRCQAVCPVYLATGQERLVARGKLALIDAVWKGMITPSEAFIETISRCLLCGACRDYCARAVATDAIIQRLRAASAKALGLPRFYSLLFAGLSRPRLLGAAGQLGRLAQGLLRVLPGGPTSLLPWLNKYSGLPPLASRPFLPAGMYPAPAPGAVGLFVGCGANYFYPDAARAALGLLEAAGVLVVVPPDQGCCGLPAHGAGDDASSAELAKRNTAAFAGLSSVVVLCASCAHRLRGYQGLPEVKLLPELLEAAPLPQSEGEKLRVAYHAPCHARFHRPGKEAMTRWLSRLAHIEYVPTPDACCGSGGLFGLSHPELARSILHTRLAGLLASHPEVIVTDCSGCLLRLRRGLREMRCPVPVLHPAELPAGLHGGR